MRRKSTVAVVGAVAGSALLIGAKFAVPSLAGTHLAGHHAKTAFQPGIACAPDDHGKAGKASKPSKPSKASEPSKASSERERESGESDDNGREGNDGGDSNARTGGDDRCHTRSNPPGSKQPTPSSSVTVKPPTATPTPTRTATSPAPQPSTSATSTVPACTTTAGNAVNVASPGIGALTVTIRVCGGAITTSTGSLSQSNLSENAQAMPALNTLAVQYYKTNMSMIHYSGATLTSNAYQASLQSALTKAGI